VKKSYTGEFLKKELPEIGRWGLRIWGA